MLRATLLALLLAPLGCTANGVPGAETTGLDTTPAPSISHTDVWRSQPQGV
jgi:hypothetical protein